MEAQAPKALLLDPNSFLAVPLENGWGPILKEEPWRRGVLTIYTYHPGENLVHKHNTDKSIKFDVVGVWITTKYIHICYTEWKH